MDWGDKGGQGVMVNVTLMLHKVRKTVYRVWRGVPLFHMYCIRRRFYSVFWSVCLINCVAVTCTVKAHTQCC